MTRPIWDPRCGWGSVVRKWNELDWFRILERKREYKKGKRRLRRKEEK
jgi:hypothetical protein